MAYHAIFVFIATTMITTISGVKHEGETVFINRLLLERRSRSRDHGYHDDSSDDYGDYYDDNEYDGYYNRFNGWCNGNDYNGIDRIDRNQDSYWVKSGWLPREKECHEWFKKFNSTINYDSKSWDKEIIYFYNLIKYNSVIRQGVEQMIKDAIYEHGDETPIQSVNQMCSALNTIIKLTPKYSNPEINDDPLIGVPIAALFADVATNHAGHAVFLHPEFNKQLTKILNKWMAYLDSPQSFSISNNGNWLSEDAKISYKFENYETELQNPPYWTSWNNFFTRSYKHGVRPNFGENDDNKIQLTNDGVQLRYRYNIEHNDIFWLKDMPYSLMDIFGVKYSKYANIFVGGSIFQSYLDPFNYHQYNSPVDGIVIESDILEGAYFPQLVWQFDIDDSGAGTISLPWLLAVNARGIFIIDTRKYSNIGLVCIVAIGMGEVSSVNFYPKIGDKIKKGQQFGAFKFGGSSIAVINEDLSKYGKKLIYDSRFKPDPTEDDHTDFFVGEIMATAYNINFSV